MVILVVFWNATGLFLMIDTPDINNILIILPDMIGLTVMAQPAVKQITEFYNNKNVKLVGFHNISEVFFDEEVPMLSLLDLDNAKKEILPYLVSHGPFDIVFDFLSSRDTGGSLNHIGIPIRLGRDYPDTDFYNIKVPSVSHDKSIVCDYMEFLFAAKIPYQFKTPTLATSENTMHRGLSWLRSHEISKDKIVVMGVGGGNTRKRWPIINYFNLKSQLKQREDIDVLFVVGPKEKYLCEEIKNNDAKAIIAFNLPLDILKGVISQASCSICNDYAVMHISASIGVPTFAVFLSSDPVRWFPYVSPSKYFIKDSIPCRPCYREDCQEWICNDASLFDNVVKDIKNVNFSLS